MIIMFTGDVAGQAWNMFLAVLVFLYKDDIHEQN